MSERTNERVRIEIADGVAEVRLSRPEKLNALDGPMFDALIGAGEKIGADPSVRAVVLCAEGRAFCAGLDFSSFSRMASDGPADTGDSPTLALASRSAASPANRAQRAGFVWQEVAVPVIAAIEGAAFGGGLQVALGADIRIVSPEAQMSIMEIKWGLIPDMAGTQLLRRLVRLDVLKELTFSGRIVSGEEAVAIGLATRSSADPLAEARALAHDIAGRSPDAVRAAKRLLNASGELSLADGLALEEQTQLSLIGRPNQVEAVRANLEKRAPAFSDVSPATHATDAEPRVRRS